MCLVDRLYDARHIVVLCNVMKAVYDLLANFLGLDEGEKVSATRTKQ
jgi:hypothetical protein